jgi:hypothetical protein
MNRIIGRAFLEQRLSVILSQILSLPWRIEDALTVWLASPDVSRPAIAFVPLRGSGKYSNQFL